MDSMDAVVGVVSNMCSFSQQMHILESPKCVQYFCVDYFTLRTTTMLNLNIIYCMTGCCYVFSKAAKYKRTLYNF